MKTAKLLIALFILTGIFFAQSATQNPQQQPGKEPGKPKVVPPNKKPAQTPAKTKTEKVLELKGLDPALMDKSADPCADFYQYSCGGWLKQNPVPGDQSSYGRDTELAERNRLILRNILEKASVIRADRSPEEQKIGDFYSSCMDEAAIERKGSPLWGMLLIAIGLVCVVMPLISGEIVTRSPYSSCTVFVQASCAAIWLRKVAISTLAPASSFLICSIVR